MTVNSTVAQIVPDNTLPINSVVTPQGNINVIDGGTVAGSHLFHSFQEFSVPTGGTAFFNNSLNIQNILTRVTGKSVSNINGVLQANGSANLFLLNPNGIIFGRDAALNIGGSFVASTASSIKFADGSEFSAINPQNTSLLSVTVPLGLQFPGIPANIINRSTNLQTLPEKTIALVGGDITLEGSQLTAAQGRIELGSVGSNNLVSLNPTASGWTLGYNNINDFGNIQLLSQSTVSGAGGGSIQVQGGRVALTDSSNIIADTLGNQNGGEIFVRAKDLSVTNGSAISVQTSSVGNAGRINLQADTLEISGASAKGQFSTIAATSRGSGNSGSINITTNRLTVRDGGDVSVTTFNLGQGGNLTVNASEIVELIGTGTSLDGQNFSRSGLFAATEGTGKGGDVRIDTPKLQIRDGARVSVSTRGIGQGGVRGGQGGNLFVKVREIDLNGVSADGRFSSGLFASSGEVRPDIPNPSQATGNGGDIRIESGQLIIRDGAQVSATTEGTGQAGNITVVTDILNVTGASTINQQLSTLSATSRGTGNSGNITIDTKHLRVTDGADISVTAFGTGRSGKIDVSASSFIELIGSRISPDGQNFSRSGLFAATDGTEKGGDITINTPKLRVQDGARVSVSTRGRGQNVQPGGQGGSLFIRAGEIELGGVGVDSRFPSGLFALSGEERPNIPNPSQATGNGGDITIVETGQLIIRDGAQVSAATLGSGKGGNITVQADAIEITGASSNGQIFSTLAATSRGTGDSGDITINTRQLRVTDGADISTTSFGTGRSGDLSINASNLIELIGFRVSPDGQNFSRSGLFAATEGTQDGGSLTVNTARLVIGDGARISVSTRGRGENGNPGGRGGNLIVNASDRIELSGISADGRFPSGLFALSGEERPNIPDPSQATGAGGNLEITTGLLSIRDNAEASVSARGLAPSGNLQAQARSIRLQNGSITGRTVQGNGANITLQVQDSLQLRGTSQISTTAGANGNGGNIRITADTIAIIEGSSIRADAGLQGGNVQIATQGLFARPGTISASSALGTQFDGLIDIDIPDVDSNQELTNVSDGFLNAENQVAQACASEQGKNRNQFLITGRGGLPPSPTEPLSSEIVKKHSTLPQLENSLRNEQVTKRARTLSIKYPRPATGLSVNTKGEVLLTANASNFIQSSRLPAANCHVR
ncbi:filamentous hemagglutinin N-terminal domain-containing protein [Scytonema sp. UIC 10036]|uniref:two-partner secretion domain-containing protein n=1 Tax=Scytonema sp. UIC 10036 TaxID=2304196 RepID=UPI00140F5577|nr:filamentous hemagglutinin N-terminal domain-containing protein [Scytonema sp. UIC 10036]